MRSLEAAKARECGACFPLWGRLQSSERVCGGPRPIVMITTSTLWPYNSLNVSGISVVADDRVVHAKRDDELSLLSQYLGLGATSDSQNLPSHSDVSSRLAGGKVGLNEELKRSRSIPRHFGATCQVQGLSDLPRNDGLRIPRQQPPPSLPLAVPGYSGGLVPRCS